MSVEDFDCRSLWVTSSYSTGASAVQVTYKAEVQISG
jgi:hypothetical protein